MSPLRSRTNLGRALGVLALTGALSAGGVGLSVLRPAQGQGTSTSIGGTLENDQGGMKLTLKGSVPKWPDESFAFVKVFVKDGPDIDTYRIKVTGGTFSAVFDSKERRKSAPLVLRAELWLVVAKQPPAIKNWFQRELAVSKDHSEIVDVCDISLGSADEQRKFRVDMQKKCSELLDRVKGLVDRTAEVFEKTTPEEWSKAKGPLTDENRKLLQDYLDIAKDYVSIGKEARLLSTVNAASLAVARAMSKFATNAGAAAAAMGEARGALENAAALLEKYRAEVEGSDKAAPGPVAPGADGGKAPAPAEGGR